MRILHTADWHLGKLFYGNYLTEDQAYVLEQQLLPMIRDEGIDAVVLAGDVYDRSLPPAEAVELFDDVATRITADLHVPFLVISGNHDSPARLSFASRLLAPQGLYMAGELERLTGPVVLEDDAGPVAFLTVPYAAPAVVRQCLGQDEVRSHQQAMEALLGWQGSQVPDGVRTVCVAHAFVAGGVASDSERPLSIGGTDQVTSGLFAPFSYTALGHLHAAQANSYNVRYSGSLLKYSFAEASQKKGLQIVDLKEDGAVEVETVYLTAPHELAVLKGEFQDLLENPRLEAAQDYLQVVLTDQAPILDAKHRLETVYPNILQLGYERLQPREEAQETRQRKGLTTEDLFGAFFRETEGTDLTDQEKELLHQVLNELAAEGRNA